MNGNWTFWLGPLFTGLAAAVAGITFRGVIAGAYLAVENDLAEKLRRLHAPVGSLRRWLIVWLVVTVGVVLGMTFGLDSPVFALVAASFLLAGPWYLIRQMAERRRLQIEDQLADSMGALANAVRAGLSLVQSLEILASECPRPINAEFQQIVGEYKLGKTLDRTLTEAKERLRSENFALFAAAMLASHESGGRLNETVDRIARSVLELQRLERKVKSETAQARRSALYMAAAPPAILVVYYFVDPLATRLLFTKTIGQILLATALVFNVAAYFWAKRILNPDL